ncbi:MAG: hypothetical protein E7618_08095, partial [Ruminococcaceae bacterium]|nr:hypothetical protein [Oscillospiraceae bacterium]
MNAIKKRSAIYTCLCFCLVSLLAVPFGATIKLVALGGTAISITVLFLLHALRFRLGIDSPLPLLPPALAIMASLTVSLLYFQWHIGRITSLDGQTVSVEAVVESVSLRADHLTTATVAVKRVDGDSLSFSALLDIPYEYPL